MKEKRDRKQNLIIVLLIVIILILLAPALLLGAVFYSNTRQIQMQQPAATQTSTGDPELDRDLALVRSATEIASYHMPGFNFVWQFDPKTRVAYINAIRSDYSGYFVENARAFPDAYLVDWNNSVDRAIAAQKHVQQYFAKSEADDITAIVNIMDYDDRETPYLTVASGVVGYDVVKGIDLRGSGES